MVFSGIIDETAIVKRVTKKKDLYHLEIMVSWDFLEGLKLGTSVSVDGVCLTVSKVKENILSFDLVRETLNRTTLEEIISNDSINIERSIKYGDEIGGHIVSGHISNKALVCRIERPTNNYIMTFQVNSDTMRYIFPKGFIALNGISLTVGETTPSQNTFTTHIIPETLRNTNLTKKEVGDYLNLEIDSQTRSVVDTILNLDEAKNG